MQLSNMVQLFIVPNPSDTVCSYIPLSLFKLTSSTAFISAPKLTKVPTTK